MGVCFARQLAHESVGFKTKAAELERAGKKEKALVAMNNSCDEIWIVARRAEKLEAVRKNIQKELNAVFGGGEDKVNVPLIKAVPLDISGKKGALALRDLLAAEKTAGGLAISVLVNNAGFGTYGEFADTDPELEMDMVDLDCTSVAGITGFALPYMDPFSRIINTASLASYSPLGNFAVYGACKAFVLSFTVALAAELKDRGIRVTALCPGPVSTEFANVASKGARKEVLHGLSAEKTVAHCLKKSRRGKLYSVMAFKWKIQAYGSRFVSRYSVARFTYLFKKRPCN